ncbi:WS/DGAT/MGAT family O-acyltransferase [Bailinhaonella thermotolerans]|uniref:Diacylglycerol O-acyltransferase n=1 Tax=Bailinhaonella thermotolerans TaxID=1070861 RepID=A0A3A4A870_9ACTN|nr:wax ester/triacylglycerol synthase family O-acyltransferase [Bailinhaonella thermotolerans]RJL22093.1 wax ester/triacylglycerol synthase family O-acyltransferase [Bailinhaonella thermotolerans]
MQQLSGLDAIFLNLETRGTMLHIASVCVLDPSTAEEPLTLDWLCRHVSTRLDRLPILRCKLAEVPLGIDQPYWVDDEDFDLEYHIRELALAPPGNDAQLAEQCARLSARPLDRARPLWETYLIHGLEGGRVAVYTKAHHAAIDGVSGAEVLATLLDVAPGQAPPQPPADTWRPEPAPGQLELLARGAVGLLANPLRALRLIPSLTAPVRLAARAVSPIREDGLTRPSMPSVLAPRTPFNATISRHRRWAFRSMSLDDVKDVKNHYKCTVNDVVMAMCAGALRRWLEDHDALPDNPLVAAVPISVRTEETRGTLGNQVSVMFPGLPTHLADPVERLRAVQAAMAGAKEQHGALPATMLQDFAKFATPAVAALAARAISRIRWADWIDPPANIVISNVPGPGFPLYLGGAKLLAYYPLSALTDSQGLNITVLSYLGQLHFGLLACRELVPDVDDIAAHLQEELDALLAAVK